MKILIGFRNCVYADYIGYCLSMKGHEVKVVDSGMDIVHLLFFPELGYRDHRRSCKLL
jgi:hypothetical protein